MYKTKTMKILSLRVYSQPTAYLSVNNCYGITEELAF